ncbi:neurogenic locus notch homolog protein 2-like isoform X2 [Scleropages formosus]|uniref:neurogenic locus notch homolog protein 2-like isoform X2 n=1 Tax=Scleropages formosus TaxID=113540 RepID=UPI0010FAA15D|nr:neurogenic locus notch homolog protein 2-like isoform X2 [Scleropages formosus]
MRRKAEMWTVVFCMPLLALSAALSCPDGGQCPDGNTCCQKPSGNYGCCPLPHAVCCEDHKHCCYENTICDLVNNRCLNNSVSLDMVKKVPAKLPSFPKSLPMIPAFSKDANYDNICLDNTRCPSEFSCLKTPVAYSCCPSHEGVPCSDGKHCCPKGQLCTQDGHFCITQKGPMGAVLCPDKESECPGDTTCCQLPDNSWGCCPMSKAVCCEDKTHCCPEGTSCNIKDSKCLSPLFGEMPMWKKLPARRRADWEEKTGDVPCDSTHACQDGSTCCKTTTGEWACCPLPQAVCCEDHVHCCPQGTTCNTAKNTCESSSGSVPWLEKVPAMRQQSDKAGDVPCDSTHACQDGSTCCKTTTGEWACCPLPQAVCCEDHVHCCPQGTTCNTAKNTCESSSGSVPWLEKVPAMRQQSDKAGDVPCDSTHACQDGSTCCKTTTGEWACCPLPQAVCCEDHVHCCPQGTTCNTAKNTCESSSGSVPWLEKVPAMRQQSDKAGDVPCDSTHACQDGSTCCKTTTGEWACCPLPQAVCCEDHVHCCPQGTTCNTAKNTCESSSGSVPWLEKVPAMRQQSDKAGDVPCDSTHACQDGSTCCKTTTGEWACCPLPQAVCCEDHVHCCPQGTTCNTAKNTCESSSGSVPWLEKVPAMRQQSDKAGDVPCDSTHACQDGSTCCKTTTGEWACCPLPQAVCCEDHVHCCPQGTTCNTAKNTCESSSGSVPWLEKVPAMRQQSDKAGDVPCDSTHACQDGSTCCKTTTGEWACCPLPQAVCCEDHVHCCPQGTTCNTAKNTCESSSGSVPWLEKVPAMRQQSDKAGDVPCDSTHACQDGSTCCKTTTGEWACCPLPQAVCCEDHVHCCPQGTTCNTAKNTCESSSGSVPWLEKVPAMRQQSDKAGDVPCDSTHACQDGSTCCKTTTGEWACCPLPQAVCCEDHVHCCPQGTTCNTAKNTCESSSGSVPWLEKVPAMRQQSDKAGDVPCDSTHACQDGSTCCKTTTGEWACCPLPQAVCCEDHVHCCPQGTTCNTAKNTCESSSGSVPWLEKVPAMRQQSDKAGDVPCDSTHACQDGSTCCKTTTGEWACCPLPQAVCCEDHVHCCPQGTTCNTAKNTCESSSGSVPWLEKVPAMRQQSDKAGDVPCDSTHACQDGSTCCKTTTGEWACCPLPQAVCCEDHVHCCPQGTTCNTAKNTCESSSGSVPWLEKVPAMRQQSDKAGDVPCDSTHACQDGSTCCKTTTGEWACCPLPQAVCCEDHVHCCPQGTTCNTAKNTCESSSGSVPWLEKVPAMRQQSDKAGDVPCDSTHACQDGSTCCKTTTGEWACCPLPQAVCCEDHVHCCPQGTTCNTAKNTCESSSGSVPWLEKVPAMRQQSDKAGDVPCDSTHACQDGSTCCKTTTGEWACCPLPQAVCCEDHVHCCPQGTTCNTAKNTCESSSGSVPWLEKVPAMRQQSDKAGDVPCDSTHACQDGSTCCKTTTGEWACCPLPQAVCCEDHVHCCPQGTTCNTAKNTCESSSGSVPWLEKVPAMRQQSDKAGDVPCDSTHACQDGSTCCKTTTGEWACCPLPQAVCCEDHVHCCPQGTTCNTAKNTCESSSGSVPWLEKVPAMRQQSDKAGDVPCDSTHACQDGSTCCKTTTGEWACCPLPQAVCCEDHVHCCPQGTTCNTAKNTCESSSGSVPWLEKVPAMRQQSDKAGDVPCDSTHACQDGSTCCKTTTGEWACCPLPQAVCCEDHVHCCPQGTTCNTAKNTCESSSGSVPWLEKVPAMRQQSDKAGDVPCDSTHACQDGSTCCKTTTGEWACCPLPQAVCCEDHVHCCPQGTTCNTAKNTCESSSGSVPWLEKVPAMRQQSDKAGDVPCDSTHACQDGSTCCKTTTGEWACCPLPQAVCCEDHIHCCPQGTTCNTAKNTCESSSGSVPWLEKVPALTQKTSQADVNSSDRDHCGSDTNCPKDTTCCFMKNAGIWGCCPFPKAVCCEDGTHCCPAGYSCDGKLNMCSKAGVVIPWYNKIGALGSSSSPPAVKCKAQSSCPSGTTCHKLSSGELGCCPLTNAVCCSNHEHCCPRGYRCNIRMGTCEKVRRWLVHSIPMTRVSGSEQHPFLEEMDVQCDDQHHCRDRETCCRKSPTEWACCPSPEAVCCPDMKHCCPFGYTCDPAGGSCTKLAELRWDSWNLFFGRRRPFIPL